MIHTVNSLSIRTYGEIDRTGNISLLKRWFNPFPVTWFDTDKLFFDVRGILGENTNNTLSNEIYKQIAYNTILMLDRMLKTMSVLMRNQNDRSLFRVLFKKSVVNYDGNLDFYFEKVKKITGIEIKDGNDLEKLAKEVQRRIDKYNERYPKDEEPKNEVIFMDIVMGVFSIIGMDYTPGMTMAEFGRLKVRADNIIKQREKKKA